MQSTKPTALFRANLYRSSFLSEIYAQSLVEAAWIIWALTKSTAIISSIQYCPATPTAAPAYTDDNRATKIYTTLPRNNPFTQQLLRFDHSFFT